MQEPLLVVLLVVVLVEEEGVDDAGDYCSYFWVILRMSKVVNVTTTQNYIHMVNVAGKVKGYDKYETKVLGVCLGLIVRCAVFDVNTYEQSTLSSAMTSISHICDIHLSSKPYTFQHGRGCVQVIPPNIYTKAHASLPDLYFTLAEGYR